jgi:hypothetical protein
VAYGNLAYTVDGSGAAGGRRGVAVTQRPSPDGSALAEASTGNLSPDGRLLAAQEHDSLAIYATDDGQDVTPDVDGYSYVTAYDWVGDDVATVLALRDHSADRASGDVLTCDVSDDACAVVSSFRDAAPSTLVPATGDPVS